MINQKYALDACDDLVVLLSAEARAMLNELDDSWDDNVGREWLEDAFTRLGLDLEGEDHDG